MSPIHSRKKLGCLVGTLLMLAGCSDSGAAALLGPGAAGAAGEPQQVDMAGAGGEAGYGGVPTSGAGEGGAPTSGGARDGGAPAEGGAHSGGAGAGSGGFDEGGAGGDGGTSSAMAAVQAIFDERCTVCHDAALSGLPSYPELPLTAGSSYAALVNHRALQPCGGTRVVPGHPEQSYLIAKLTQDTPCDGARMPQPYEPFLPFIALTDEQMATITDWISAGAPP